MRKETLLSLGQNKILAEAKALSPSKRKAFQKWLDGRSFDRLQEQRQAFLQKEKTFSYEPWRSCKQWNTISPKRGEKLLKKGKVASLILAGGQGSRLGFSGPKGIFPLKALGGKSLFQLFCERILKQEKKYGQEFLLAIFTSPLNHKETEDFFVEKKFFGLKKEQISFFSQEMLPFLDEEGNWLWEKEGKIAEGPDGNGSVFHQFYEKGLWKSFQERGVDFLEIFSVDNGLAEPLEPLLLSFHTEENHEISLVVIDKKEAEGKMGFLAQRKNHLRIAEYMEITPEQKELFFFANVGIYCMDFVTIEKLAKGPLFPLHKVKKKVQVLVRGAFQELFVGKYERFIFDALAFVKRAGAVVFPKEKCYAPLKEKKDLKRIG